jgi:hypothetical protein
MRHLTVLLAFLVSFSIQAAGVVGFGGSKLIPEGTIKDVRNYGIAGNSATNYSTQLQNMIASNLTAGDVIGFFYGTNTVSGITLSNTQSIYIAPGAVVKWPDSATNAMFTMTADWKGIIYGGGTIDGGTQTTNQFQYNGLLNTRSDNGKIENITFRNSVRAAIYDISSYGNLEITGCRFFNAMQLPTTATFANAFVSFAPGASNTAPHFRFTGNVLSNSTLTGRWSGGVYVAANDNTSSVNSYLIADNHFYNVGDDHVIGPAHYGIAAIDLYEDGRNGIVRGNHIYSTRYIGIKGQNTQNLLIEGNFVYESAASVGIAYTSGERQQTNAYNGAIIRNNFVRGNGTSTYGIWVGPGDAGTNVGNVLIDGNILTNCYRGINLQGYNRAGQVSAMGPIKIRDNIIAATNNNAIMLYGTRGDIDISGNSILTQGAGSGIVGLETNSTTNIRIDGNTIVSVGYGIALWGVGSISGDNNKITSTAESIYFKQDNDGNLIGNLAWGQRNRIISGTESITRADIVTGYSWTGDDMTIYPGGLVTGPTSGIQYRFRYNTNVAENILRVHNLDTNGTGAALFTVGTISNLFTIGVYDHAYPTADIAGRVELKPESNSAGADYGSKTAGKTTRIFGGTTAGISVTDTNASVTGIITGYSTSTGSTTARTLADRFSVVKDVIDYGADPTGVADSSTAINLAKTAALAATPTDAAIYFPPGVYLVNSTISDTTDGSYISWIGSGPHVTYIKAGAAMTQILLFGNSTNVFDGRKRIEGITFDQNTLSTCGVDASLLAYSTFSHCEFIKPTSGGFNLRIGKWANRIENCIFNGNSVGNGIDIVSSGALPINGLEIENMNSFTLCLVGIRGMNGLVKTSIRGNVFDACTQAGIWLRGGSYTLAITDNYFEACGSSGVSVETAAATFTTYYGAIVMNPLYNAIGATAHENFTITGNQFSNCSSDSIITLNNIVAGTIKANHIYPGYTHTNFVNIRGTGSIYTAAKATEIEYTSTAATVINPVGLNGDDLEQNSAGLKITINDKVQYARFPNIGGEIYGNPLSWSSFGTTGSINFGRDGFFEDIYKVWKIERSSGSDYYLYKSIAVNTTGSVSSIQGPRYLRIQYATRGDAGNANGLQVSALVDGVTQVVSTRTSETWRAAENLLVYIPSTATNLQIVLTPVTGVIPCWLTKFSISDASLPFGHEQSLTDLDYFTPTAVAPTYGTWTTGDKVFYKAASTTGFIGAICTATGTPGTWAEFGALSSGFTTTGGQFDSNATAGNT